MIVSITDQVLMVCPTVIPKYSLTSQNPASLTWEKNSEPAPTASASSATVGRSSPAASGATMPAAVMVATVAEPVANRMPTATSQPSISGERLAPYAASAIRSPTPESTSSCLKPPPAATISRIPAMAGSAPPTVLEIRCAAEADGRAEREHREEHAGQERDQRGADDVEHRPERLPSSRVSSPIAPGAASARPAAAW